MSFLVRPLPLTEPFVMKRREECKVDEGAGYRHARLEGLVLEELGALLRDDVSDPALFGVRITAIVLSVDYRHARVHYALQATTDAVETERGHVERALGRATPFMRAQLADAIEQKRTPDLKFVFDGIAPVEDTGEGSCSE